jgi:hypothetical protein
MDRLILVGAALGLAGSLVLHVAGLAAGPVVPVAPWSWVLHAGTVAGLWCAAARLAAAGLRGIPGLRRVRRMVPIPVRLALGAATVNALATGALALAGGGVPGRALTAYWTMIYLLVAILFAFVDGRPNPPGRTPIT